MANLGKDYYLDEQGLQTLINELETNLVALEYSSSATYAVDDYCVHDNKMYRCTTAITTAESWDSTHWSLVIIGDEIKSKKSGTVTSVTIKGTSPIVSSSESAITTSGTRTISHANSGVTAGDYTKVTVNATGHVTAGSNPTTLSGYGITDAKIESGTITLGSNTITPITSHQTVTDNNPTLDWGTQSKVATIGSTDIHVTMPSNPNTDLNVSQSRTNSTQYRKILLSKQADNDYDATTTSNTDVVYASDAFSYKANGGILRVPNIITSGYISAAPPEDNEHFPASGFIAQDVRNATDFFTTTAINFIMGGWITDHGWSSGIHFKPSGGAYAAWELMGYSLNGDGRTKPLYVRGSNKNVEWGDWRKIYDTSNPPTYSEVGAAPTSHAHGNIASGGTISSSAITLASGDYILVSDTSASGKIERGIALGTSTTTYLTNKGTWATPVGTTYADGTGITIGTGNAINHSNSVTAQTTQKVYPIKIDAQGHISAYGTSPTTLSGYGITDAKIASGVITLGSNTITPLTASSTLDATKLSGTIPSGCYTNTTYTFAGGTNKITVTPSGGTPQDVTITPSITNNITGSGTSGYLTKFNGTNTITNGPQLGSSTTTYLRNDGTWATPTDTKVTQSVLSSTATNWRKVVLGYSGSSSAGASASDVTNITYVDNPLEYNPDTETLKTTIFSATDGINAHTSTDSTTGGVALWNTNPALYGITMRTTGTASGELGKHGYVQGDYAVYFCINSTTGATTQQRGWVFRHHRLSDNVASMDISGNAVFNGSVTIGGNDTNTSGCRLTFNAATQSCDFVFA